MRVRSMIGLIPLCAAAVVADADRRPSCPSFAAARARVPRATGRSIDAAVDLRGGDGSATMLALVGRRPAAADPRAPARRGRVPLALRHALALRDVPRTTRSCSRSTAPRRPGRLRAGRVDDGAVRRQLELARAGLVPGQLPAHRGARAATHQRLGDEFTVECPTGSGAAAARSSEISRRPGRRGWSRSSSPTRTARRPVFGDRARFRDDPAWRDACCSTSTSTATPAPASAPRHQTGWTGLVADLVDQLSRAREQVPPVDQGPAKA